MEGENAYRKIQFIGTDMAKKEKNIPIENQVLKFLDFYGNILIVI